MLACSRPVSTWLSLNTQIDLNAISERISEGSPADRAVVSSLLILGLIVLLNRLKKVGTDLRRCWPLILFLMYCFISLTWSDFPDIAFKRLIREIGDWVMVLVVWTDPHPITALKRLLARASYTLIPLSILFAKYYSFGRSYGFWTGETAYIGVTDNKNTLGSICVLFGLASVWHLLNAFRDSTNHRQRRIVVHVVIVAMVAYLLTIADSVTSIVCTFLVIGVLLALRYPVFARRRFMIHVLVLATVSIPVFIALLGAFPGALEAMGRNATLTDRTLIWSWVIKLVPNQWVGAGFSSFWLGPRLEEMIANVTHTLEVFANLGWVGVGLLGLVIFWGYFSVVDAWRAKRQASDLMLAYFLAGVISNISEASFFRSLVPVWLFLMIAITMPSIEREQRSEQLTNAGERSHLTDVTTPDAVWTAG